ncbi:MAG: glycosyltransferase, partial [Candidatus Krumholzibacteriia bacterium]
RAAVAVMPLRFGSGSRSRLAQLLSMGVPTVITPVAARMLDVVSGDGVLVAPDGADFAEAVAQVLNDSSLRKDLSRRGRETAEARLSMRATYEHMTEVLGNAALELPGGIRCV